MAEKKVARKAVKKTKRKKPTQKQLLQKELAKRERAIKAWAKENKCSIEVLTVAFDLIGFDDKSDLGEALARAKDLLARGLKEQDLYIKIKLAAFALARTRDKFRWLGYWVTREKIRVSKRERISFMDVPSRIKLANNKVAVLSSSGIVLKKWWQASNSAVRELNATKLCIVRFAGVETVVTYSEAVCNELNDVNQDKTLG